MSSPLTSPTKPPAEVVVVAADEASAKATLKALDGGALAATWQTPEAALANLQDSTTGPALLLVLDGPRVDAVAMLDAIDPHRAALVTVIEAAAPLERTIALLRSGAAEVVRAPVTRTALVDAVTRGDRIRRRPTPFRRNRDRAESAGVSVPISSENRHQPQHPLLTAIHESVRSGEVAIPSVPVVVGELRQALRGGETSMQTIASLIQRDQNLVASVLRLANTPEFSRGGRVGDLPTAVTRIGTRRIETILEAIFLHDCYRPRDPRYQAPVLSIWRSSVARATAMRALTESLHLGLQPGTVYVAGLLADVGALFLLWVISERAPELSIDDVMAFVRLRHAATGSEVLTAWKFDATFVQLAMAHHVARNPVPKSAIWSLSTVAAELAERHAEDITSSERPTAAEVGRCLHDLKGGEADLTTAAGQIERELDSLGAAVG